MIKKLVDSNFYKSSNIKHLAEELHKEGITKIAILGTQDSWEKAQAENVRNKFEEHLLGWGCLILNALNMVNALIKE